MCCHEGVDRPPKPPKKLAQYQPAPASSKNNTNSHKGSSIPQPVQAKLQMDKSNNAGLKSRIEKVDLAQDNNRSDYAKVGPRDYRNLHRLHEKVSKASPVPTIAHTKPPFSYSKGEQPKLSFFSKGVDSANHFRKSSSDNDDDWMDDLPSPSTLLGQKKSAETTTHKGSDYVAEILAFDEDMSDIEADMVGLSDLVGLEDSSIHEARTAVFPQQDERFNTNISNYEDDDVTWNLPVLPSPRGHQRYTCEQDKGAKLFLSTDSPEKPTLEPLKRKSTSSSDVEVSTSSTKPLPKKAKREDRKSDIQETSIDRNQAVARDLPPPSSSAPENQGLPPPSPNTLEVQHGLHPSSSILEMQSASPKPTIRPGYPAWVYDLDPEFVAEYEDYVEFV